MADGQVVFEITGDNKGIKDAIKDTTDAIGTEAKKWETATTDATDNMESSFSGSIKRIVAAIGAAKIAEALYGWGKQAIAVASDLEEVQNVVDVTFGKSAGVIEAWASRAGKQFGLTELQAKQFTSTLGAMMKSSGIAGDEIVEMSTDLAGLAADMASFYNLDFDTAFQKIRSGISGETEPLKAIGVNMSAANLEAYALAEGIETAYSEMSQAEQVMLRYKYLMSATADAQGDFSRTQDSYANQVRMLETMVNTLTAQFGEVLLPIVSEVVGKINDMLSLLVSGEKRTILDDFAEIDLKSSEKIAEIDTTARKAESLLGVIEKIKSTPITLPSGEETTYDKLFESMMKIEADGGDVKAYVEGLGLEVDALVIKYGTWKSATEQLTQTIPGLSDVINGETGELQGGAQAVEDYITAWANGQKRLAYINALQEKQEALAQKYSELPSLALEAEMAMEEYEQSTTAAAEAARKMFADSGVDTYLGQSIAAMSELELITSALGKFEFGYMNNDAYKAYTQANQKMTDVVYPYQEQLRAYEEAQAELEQQLQWWEERYGETGEAMGEAIAGGLGDAVPDIWAKIESINSALAQIRTPGGLWNFAINGSHANGLDYVPFDNYLAQLHEGESILTAEEAKVWRDFKYGQKMTANAIDYDALSGALRSSGGGNVYLDGQTVGRVISARQADSLRAMERSGWKS